MPLPAALAIDVEPDPRLVYGPDPSHWAGFEASRPFFDELRDEIAEMAGEAPTFTWLLRMDAQMKRAYGRHDWIAEHYGDRLQVLEAAGDDLGLHTHLYRWNESKGTWFTDMRDPAYGVDCFREAIAAWRERFRRDMPVHSFGDRWLTGAAVGALDAEGVRVEFTPESGLAPRERFRVDEDQDGALCDYRKAPRSMWRPAIDDFLRDDPASPRRLRIQPVATYRFPLLFEAGRAVDLTRRRLRGDVPSEDDRNQRTVRICLGQRSYVVRYACHQLLRDHAPRSVHFVMRASQIADPGWRARARANILWLAGGGLGEGREVRFVSATRMLDWVDARDDAAQGLRAVGAAVQ